MSLPVIAIIVAGASMLFTGANVLVTILTYRRTRPRVRITCAWGVFGGAPSYPSGVSGKEVLGFEVRMRNLSPTAAEVEKIEAVPSYASTLMTGRGGRVMKRKIALFEHPKTLEMPRIKLAGGRFKEANRKLAPFGGLRWEVPYKIDQELLTRWAELTIRITLTNGSTIDSPKFEREMLGEEVEHLRSVTLGRLPGLPPRIYYEPLGSDGYNVNEEPTGPEI
jgi:hypothetical protein